MWWALAAFYVQELSSYVKVTSNRWCPRWSLRSYLLSSSSHVEEQISTSCMYKHTKHSATGVVGTRIVGTKSHDFAHPPYAAERGSQNTQPPPRATASRWSGRLSFL